MNETATFVVIGLDSDGKAHGAWFAESDREALLRAARRMGMRVLSVVDEPQAALASVLPAGKLFNTGKAFVPFVKRETYDRFASLIGTDAELALVAAGVSNDREDEEDAAEDEAAEAADEVEENENARMTPPVEIRPAPRSDPWAAIVVGSLVLAKDPDDAGWYEALVHAIGPGDVLSLRWRDWPKQRSFSAARRAVAILPDRK